MQAIKVVVEEMVVSCGVAYEDGSEVVDNGNCRAKHGWLSFKHLDLLHG